MKTRTAISLVVCLPLFGGCPSNGGGNDASSMDDVIADGFDDDGGQCDPRLVEQISNNHGHALPDISGFDDVPQSAFVGGRNASHSHGVELNGGHVEQLLGGQIINVETSSNSLHTHTVTVGVQFPCGDGGFDDGLPDDGQAPGMPSPDDQDDG